MATMLGKTVERETRATAYDRGKERPIIVSLEAPSVIGFRLKGTGQTYRLTVGACYLLAVKADVSMEKRERR
jgi:hypothetical protein